MSEDSPGCPIGYVGIPYGIAGAVEHDSATTVAEEGREKVIVERA